MTGDVDCSALLEFIGSCHHAIVTTTRRDGSPQSSPLRAGVDAAGRVIATYPEQGKVANARGGPPGSDLFRSDDWNGH